MFLAYPTPHDKRRFFTNALPNPARLRVKLKREKQIAETRKKIIRRKNAQKTRKKELRLSIFYTIISPPCGSSETPKLRPLQPRPSLCKISPASPSILENAKQLFPRSFSDAPM